MWATMKEISQSEDGWTGLWRGFKVNLILVINPMITYGVYQWLRRGLVKLNKELGFLDAFREFSFALYPRTVAYNCQSSVLFQRF
jgi:hypothetical protein